MRPDGSVTITSADSVLQIPAERSADGVLSSLEVPGVLTPGALRPPLAMTPGMTPGGQSFDAPAWLNTPRTPRAPTPSSAAVAKEAAKAKGGG